MASIGSMQEAMYGQVSSPRPPEDQEIRNIIDKLASFVARNGPEFEQMTMEKQRSNPKFNFLFGGEHNLYYRWKVAKEQAAQGVPPVIPVPQMGGGLPSSLPPSSIPSLMSQTPVPLMPPRSLHAYATPPIATPPTQQYLPPPVPMPTSIPPSSFAQQLATPPVAVTSVPQPESKDAPPPWIQMREQQQKETAKKELLQELKKLQAKEQADLDDNTVADPLESQFSMAIQHAMESCTKDSIAAGKTWIFGHAQSMEDSKRVARFLMRKSLNSAGITFSHKLHIVYLINDVIHHCVRKGAGDLKQAIEEVLVLVFYNVHTSDPEKHETLLKVLKIWETQKYFEEKVLERIRAVVTLTQEDLNKLSPPPAASEGAVSANPWNKDAGTVDAGPPWQQQSAATSGAWSQGTSQATPQSQWGQNTPQWQQQVLHLQQKVQQHLQQHHPARQQPQPTPLFPPAPSSQQQSAHGQYSSSQAGGGAGGEYAREEASSDYQESQESAEPSRQQRGQEEWRGQGDSEKDEYSSSQKSDYQEEHSQEPAEEPHRTDHKDKEGSGSGFKGAKSYDYRHGEGNDETGQDGKDEGLEMKVIDYNHQSRSRDRGRTKDDQEEGGEERDVESSSRGRNRWDRDGQQQSSPWGYHERESRHEDWEDDRRREKWDSRSNREQWDDEDRRDDWGPRGYDDRRGPPPPRMMDPRYPPFPPHPDWDRGNYPPWDGGRRGEGSWDDRRGDWSEDRRDDPSGWDRPPRPGGMPPWDGRDPGPWDGRGPPPPHWDGPPMPPFPPWDPIHGPPGGFGPPPPPPMGAFPPEGPPAPPPPPIPSIPYYDLPAGIMVSVVRIHEHNYRPLRPSMMTLPPPRPPTERLLKAVEEFYEEDKDGKRNHEGWEAKALLGFFDAKNRAIEKIKKARRPVIQLRKYKGRSRSRSYSPRRRRSGRSRSRSYSRSRSRSRSPRQRRRRSSRSPSTDRSSRSRSRSRSSSRSRSYSYSPRRRRRSRSRSFSPFIPTVKTPPRRISPPELSGPQKMAMPPQSSPTDRRSPSEERRTAPDEDSGPVFVQSKTMDSKLEQDNVGHQLLKKMGWEEGLGLGAQMQGIEEPIKGGDVRDNVDKYKGLGINMKDPFEMFRKNKSFSFNNRSRGTS